MRNIDDLKAIVMPLVASAGFQLKPRSRAASWYRKYEDVVQVLNLQTSPYGHQYYVNIGFALLQLPTTSEYPTEYECHVSLRISQLLPDMAQVARSLLDLDTNQDDASRATGLIELIGHRLLPTLDAARTPAGVSQLVRDLGRNVLITPAVRAYLNVPR